MDISVAELLRALLALSAVISFCGFTAYAIGYGYTKGKRKGGE